MIRTPGEDGAKEGTAVPHLWNQGTDIRKLWTFQRFLFPGIRLHSADVRRVLTSGGASDQHAVSARGRSGVRVGGLAGFAWG